jgi:hypothetical protein
LTALPTDDAVAHTFVLEKRYELIEQVGFIHRDALPERSGFHDRDAIGD